MCTYFVNNDYNQLIDASSNKSMDSNLNNYQLDLESLKKSVLQFSLQYYGKFNLSRKEATELQNNITKTITSSIAKELEKITNHNNLIDNDTKKFLTSIINFCNDPFEGIDTY